MSQELKNTLTNIVQEKHIADIIIDYKKDIDMVYMKDLYNQWSVHRRNLKSELSEAEDRVEYLRKKIKENCNHTDVTEYRSSGWERSNISYNCNQCCFNVNIHDEFNYINITKKVDH